MDHTEIQKRIDAIVTAMVVKALRQPAASFDIRSHQNSNVYLRWEEKRGPMEGFHFLREATPEATLDAADAFVAALPDPEKARKQEFMQALSDVVELGRQNSIEVDYLNPLVETMKRLSKNALTDQREAA